MPFDMESFLAGLAVGRVLWNPANGSISGWLMEQTEEQTTEETEQEEDAV